MLTDRHIFIWVTILKTVAGTLEQEQSNIFILVTFIL